KLPPIQDLLITAAMATEAPAFSNPEVVQAFEAIFKAGREQMEFGRLHEEIARPLGIPPVRYPGGAVRTPFDMITDRLRGMQGVSVDMFKQPEKLRAAMEKILEWQKVMAVPADPKERGRRRVLGSMSHWGAKQFLSRKQFYDFYWPTAKRSLMTAIDMGYVPVPYPEGDFDDRIECFLELPKGKILLYNQILDVVKAKEVLGGHVAFMGGVPAALLHFGSPKEVEEHCKKIIGICGKGGGYILSAAAVGEEDAKPENLKAMCDAVRKYGQY
ncbi:uroporphyrinogen decarboxylase family protein, partial [Chloroflexota bacterium]